MVKIAIAGGSGELGREVVDALVTAGKHEIILLTRKETSAADKIPNVTWQKVDYDSKAQLTEALQGVDTVLCFITAQTDHKSVAQKNLIDACVDAGVRRFAPSEWGGSRVDYLEFYAEKDEIRKYMRALNKDKQVLEYTLFQPGLFTDYFAHPHKTTKHVHTFENPIDFANRRAIVLDGGEHGRLTTTTVQDIANVVALAVEYEGEWPIEGGIKGYELSVAELIQLGEKLRGGPFNIERLACDDLEAGRVKSSWIPRLDHHAVTPEVAEKFGGVLLAAMTLGISAGSLNVSDEWNKLLPDYKFKQPQEFLSEVWIGKN